MLIDAGADVNKKDWKNRYPIEIAIDLRNECYLELLIKNGVNLNVTLSSRRSVLVDAIFRNTGIENLFKAGVDINFVTIE